jgi:hypothetical protein
MTTVQIWGNHHCSDPNKFEETITQLLLKQKRYLVPTIISKPEQCLTHKLIKKIKYSIKKDESPKVCVFILGDVDLREKTFDEVFKRFKFLSELSLNFSNIIFIVCSPIPPQSVIKNPLNQVCLKLNNKLRLELRNDRTIYVNADHRLEPEDYADELTLNETGGIKLAQAVAKAASSIPPSRLKWSK